MIRLSSLRPKPLLGRGACGFLFVLALGGVAAPAAVAEAPSVAGAYAAVAPFRAVNSFTGAYGNLHGALPAHTKTVVQVGGNGGVPSTGVRAVAVTITAEQGTA